VNAAADLRSHPGGRGRKRPVEISVDATKLRAHIIAVGNEVADHLLRRQFPKPFTRVLHSSPLAGRPRAAAIVGREDEFAAFVGSLSRDDIVAESKAALTEAGFARHRSDAALEQLRRSKLGVSLQRLAFICKLAFEATDTLGVVTGVPWTAWQ
jgi:hypothetical protein